MTTTQNYGLKKPAANEYYSIETFNENADLIDTALKDAVEKADIVSDLADKAGQPNGFATLDENGKLAQMPDAADVSMTGYGTAAEGINAAAEAAAQAKEAAAEAKGIAETANSSAETALLAAQTAQQTADAAKAITDTKGQAGGLATLDAQSKVTAEQSSAAMIDITESRSLILTDAGRLLCVDGKTIETTTDESTGETTTTETVTDVVLTIPAESETAFPIGTELEVCQMGAGAVSFAAAEGVTLLSVGGAVMVAEQYGCVTLKKLAADKWLLAGMLG